jgi:tetratricopeptide (TPR) repeat protein
LEEQRLAALEARLEADLACGRHAELVGELRRLVAVSPTRERLAEQLMLALYRCGRQADALEAYQDTRRVLVSDIGVEPGPALRELQQAILRHDAALQLDDSVPELPSKPEEGRVGPSLGPREFAGHDTAFRREPVEARVTRHDEIERRRWAVGRPALVGRDRELRSLLEVLDHASAGHGGAVVLSGEAGVGKTRLATELLQRVAAGTRVAVGGALELGGPAPLSLWAELLRDLGRGRPAALAGAQSVAELGRLVPDLDLASPSPPLQPDLERTRLYEATVSLVERLASDEPLVLLLEDLHLADSPSIELAGYVARRLTHLPVLLLLTRRELPRRPDVDAVLHGLRGRGALTLELSLAPLDRIAIKRLVRSVADLGDADIQRTVDASEGSPLLAIETARALACGQRDAPATLRAVVRATTAGLSPAGKRLTEFAAAAGRDLESAELRRLLPDEWPDAAADAIESGLLVDREGSLGFRHALLRRGSYDDLPRARRVWLHETLAQAVGTERAAESARHLRLAGRDELAVEHLARAAATARDMAALDEAESYLSEALAIVPGDTTLLLELAEVHAWRGRASDAAAALQRAVALIDPRDPVARADAHTRAGAWLRGAVCDPRAALVHYSTALDTLTHASVDDPARRAVALAGSAWCASLTGDPDEAAALIARCETRGEPLLEHDLAGAHGFAMLRAGQFAQSATALQAAAEHALQAHRPDLAYSCWINAACATTATGEFDRALATAERVLEVVRAHGLVPLELNLLAARAYVLVRLERFAEARAAVEDERRLADRQADPDAIALAAHDAGFLALAAGDPATAEVELRRALAATPAVSRPQARLARAEALTALGRTHDAEAELRATVQEPVGPADLPAMLAARFARVQGLVAAARGDAPEARRRLREAAAAWRRRLGHAHTGEAWVANIVDLGRPPVLGLVEPARELQRLEHELADLDAAAVLN